MRVLRWPRAVVSVHQRSGSEAVTARTQRGEILLTRRPGGVVSDTRWPGWGLVHSWRLSCNWESTWRLGCKCSRARDLL